MARSASPHPTDGELEILHVLWQLGPSPLGVICETLRKKRVVATTTVATMLGVMLKKKLVRRKGAGRGCRWSAAVTHQATSRQMVGQLVDRVFEGSASRLVANLVEAGKLSPEEIKELKRLLNQAPTQDGSAI